MGLFFILPVCIAERECYKQIMQYQSLKVILNLLHIIIYYWVMTACLCTWQLHCCRWYVSHTALRPHNPRSCRCKTVTDATPQSDLHQKAIPHPVCSSSPPPSLSYPAPAVLPLLVGCATPQLQHAEVSCFPLGSGGTMENVASGGWESHAVSSQTKGEKYVGTLREVRLTEHTSSLLQAGLLRI